MTAHLAPVPGARPSATVEPIRADTYERAVRIALSAKADWGAMLAAARTLSGSPDWKHQNLARHIRDAYELHRADLLKPARFDLTDDMRVRPRVTVVQPPPYSTQTRVIRRALVDAAGLAVILAAVVAVYLAGGV